jgi:hypothetical protein
VKSILFMTHVGVPGGAEFKMIDIAGMLESRREVLLLQGGPLQALLDQHRIPHSVLTLPEAAVRVRREGSLRDVLRAIPATLSMVRGVCRKSRDFDVVVAFSLKSFLPPVSRRLVADLDHLGRARPNDPRRARLRSGGGDARQSARGVPNRRALPVQRRTRALRADRR